MRISVMSDGFSPVSGNTDRYSHNTSSLQVDPAISLFPQVIPLSPAACLLSPGHFLPRYRSGIRGNSSGRLRYRAFTLEQSYLDDYL